MGKVKSMLMDAQDELFEIVDIEDAISGAECVAEFHYNVTEAGGEAFQEWLDEVGKSTANYILNDAWNEFWGAYV